MALNVSRETLYAKGITLMSSPTSTFITPDEALQTLVTNISLVTATYYKEMIKTGIPAGHVLTLTEAFQEQYVTMIMSQIERSVPFGKKD